MPDVIVGDVISRKQLEECKKDCNNTHETMSEKIDEVKVDVNDIKITLAGLPEVLLEKFEKKFASKNAEYIIYGMVAIILIAVIGYWVNMTIKQPTPGITVLDIQKMIEENNNKYFEKTK